VDLRGSRFSILINFKPERKIMEPVFKSRWGYHPCDCETYFALKRLHHLWSLVYRREAAWKRWDRKDPHNRIIRKKLRNVNGQCVGYEPTTTPIPEPKTPDLDYYDHLWIGDLYFKAKHPKAKPEEVEPFQATVKKGSWKREPVSRDETIKMIHAALEELSAWFEENGVSPKWSEKEKRIVVSS